ncbi:MAG: hypothetical protein U0K42_08850 [Bacteroidales bacterium]|nr:hypothetical protein [Bacteroidales bacterium]
MVKVNLGGCASFVKDEDYKKYVGKALEAFDVLESESGAGNDFLGWKHLPSQTPESLIADCEAVRDCWKAKGVNLVVVIGIGGSYLGARCAIEALSHNFAKQLGGAKEAPEVVFAGNNLSEEYLAELMDLVAERNVATVVISKSGTTTEPAVAFRIVKEHIEKTTKTLPKGLSPSPMLTRAPSRPSPHRKATRHLSFRTTWEAGSPSSLRSDFCRSCWRDSMCAR